MEFVAQQRHVSNGLLAMIANIESKQCAFLHVFLNVVEQLRNIVVLVAHKIGQLVVDGIVRLCHAPRLDVNPAFL